MDSSLDGGARGWTFPRGFRRDAMHWPLVPARELFELKYGRALKEEDRCAGNIPVYGTNGRCGFHDTPLFRGPGVILGRKGQGPLGVEWSSGDYWVIDTAYSLALKRQDIDLKYAYFLIKFVGLNHLKDGTSNPTLSRETFGAQALPLPPLASQRAIAHILGTLDDKIELNRRMSETLERIARTIFKHFFSDESATLANHASLNPENWSRTDYPDTITYVDLANTKDGAIEAVATYVRCSAPSRAQRVLRPGDTLVGTVRPGNRSYALVYDTGLTGSTGFAVLRPCRPQDATFVYLAATEPRNIERLAHLADGGAYPAVRPEVVHQTPAPSPPLDVLDRFACLVTPLMDRIAHNGRQNKVTAEIRDTLLPKLLSGELRVKEAERAIEAVV